MSGKLSKLNPILISHPISPPSFLLQLSFFADHVQEQEMEIEALQAILMDDIRGIALILIPNCYGRLQSVDTLS